MSQLTNLVFVSLFGCVAATAAVMQLQDRKPPVAATQMNAQQAKGVASLNAVSVPALPQQPGNTAMLYADSRGHFFADIQVRGVPVRTLVDTGASLVAMSMRMPRGLVCALNLAIGKPSSTRQMAL